MKFSLCVVERQDREWAISSAVNFIRLSILKDSKVVLLEGEAFWLTY